MEFNFHGSKVEEGPSEISTRKREISTDEQTEILEGSQTSMDNETLIKRLGRISNKMLPLKVQEIQPKVATPTKDVIARIQKKILKKPIATESLQSSIENLVDNMPLGNLEKSIENLVDHISASVVQSTDLEGSIFKKDSKHKEKKERANPIISPVSDKEKSKMRSTIASTSKTQLTREVSKIKMRSTGTQLKKNVNKTKLFLQMEECQQDVVLKFLKKATTTSIAFKVTSMFDGEDEFRVCISGKCIEDLMFNAFLDANILIYKVYKLKKAFEKDTINKYIKVLYLDAKSLVIHY
ncbi:hypothetical protein C5167_034234 [Papaver somniferum]|uniref:Uncharacterized protein n=1 Tax=Papaver somniferum TaxID=3469 RepID=A0A4Y7KC34_PAPSO|nr:hypothetical protein C5167_034234 [Papaver somniferum]